MCLPVEDVEEPIEAERSDVVAGDVLDEANLIKHNNLRDEGQGL